VTPGDRLADALARVQAFRDDMEAEGFTVHVDVTVSVTMPASTPEDRHARLLARALDVAVEGPPEADDIGQ
jgi:hypothetical protein